MRKLIKEFVVLMCFILLIAGCGIAGEDGQPVNNAKIESQNKSSEAKQNVSTQFKGEKVTMTDEEWRKVLTPEQYHVCRQKGTERAFTGKYYNNKEEGTYTCVACGNELFSSDTKFDSGTGWPSFWSPVAKGNISTEFDNSYGMKRTEVLCSKCDSHLGHVFEDGPSPTHLRYCINSVALDFQKEKE